MQALLLDLNGVLILSEPLSRRMEEEYHVPADTLWPILKDALGKVRLPGAPSIYSIIRPHLSDLGIDVGEEEFYRFWFSGETVCADALLVLRGLKKKGVKIFVVSNNFRERTEYYRQTLANLFSLVDGALFSWETGTVKPDPAVFSALLEMYDLRPEDCLYLDDSEANLESARTLGITAEKYQGLGQLKELAENAF